MTSAQLAADFPPGRATSVSARIVGSDMSTVGGPSGPTPIPLKTPDPIRDGGAELAFWRDAVLADPDVAFCILDTNARVLFANGAAGEALLGAPSTVMLSLTLRDLFAPDIAAERVGFLERTIRHDRPLIVGEVWRGVRCRSVWRLLPEQGAGTRREVLWTIRPAVVTMTHDQPMSGDVVEATHNDWGPLAVLTALQRRVLGLLASGFEVPQIAGVMGLSNADVELQRLAIERLLNATSPAVLTRRAMLAGLVGV